MEEIKIKYPKLLKHKGFSDGLKFIICCGPTGCGKTYSLPIIYKNLHPPESVFYFTRSPDQQIYIDSVKMVYGDIPVIISNEIPSVETTEDPKNRKILKDAKHTIWVFDDINIDDMKGSIRDFFRTVRQLNISCILLFQKYTTIPLDIRENSNVLLIYNSLEGYQTIWPSVRRAFKEKKIFDRIMDILDDEENEYGFISIDKKAKGDDVIKLNLCKKLKKNGRFQLI